MEPTPSAATPDPSSLAHLSFGALICRAAGHASIYTIGLLAVRTSEFLLIPVYWRLLSPADYGILAVTTIVVVFLSALLGLKLEVAITRLYYDWPHDERRGRLGSLWLWHWLLSAALALPFLLVGRPLFEAVTQQVPFDPYLRLAVWVALLTALSTSPMMTLRIREDAGMYILCSMLTLGLNSTIAIILVAGLERGVKGVLQAQIITGVAMLPIYAFLMARRARPNLALEYLREGLAFSLPLVPSNSLDAMSGVTDRFLLEKTISLNELGLYSVANRLGRAVAIFSQGLKTSWIPFEMRVVAERPDDGRQMAGRTASYFIFALVLVTAAVAVLGPALVRLMDVEAYQRVTFLLPLAVVSQLVVGIGHVVGQGYAIARKTNYAWMRTAAQFVIMVVAGILFISLWGIYGAFLASSLSALAGWGTAYLLSQRFFHIPFNWHRIGFIVLSGAVVVVISALLPPLPVLVDFSARIGLLALFGASNIGRDVALKRRNTHARHVQTG